MSSKAMSLKGRIKNYAKSNNIATQVVLQNYMFERFLERLSVSEYSEKFVVKGGMLIAAIVGLDTRSTMDLDTTLRNLPLTEEQISAALGSICKIDLNDEVSFGIKSVAPIRKDDVYGGYCVRLDAIYDTIVTPLSIDVSTGDIITPSAVKYEFGGIFDENWFERIMNNTSAIWKKEGLLLMNLSEYVSKIGDNRAFVQIGGAIAESAAMAGANDLFQFVNIVQKSKLEWKELLFDGIISMLQTNYFTEEELLIIWEKAAEYFALNEYAERFDSKNTRNKIYCADTHRAISLCAKRLGYNTLEEKMKERAPLEYAQERLDSSMHSCIIPSRWYESEYYANMEDFFDNVEQLSIDEMFSYIEEEFHRGDFSWDYIRYFIQKAKCKDSKYVSKYKPQIMEMLDKREINSLEYDGCNRLYEVLFPYLTDDEVNNVLNNVVSTYYYHKEKGWASTDYGLMTDLEHFTFALFSRFDLNDNIWALNEILKMHCLWISGTETLGIGEVYQFRENDKTITGWLDMFEKLV